MRTVNNFIYGKKGFSNASGTTINVDGREIDVTDCANAKCVKPTIITSRTSSLERSVYNARMKAYLECVNTKCKPTTANTVVASLTQQMGAESMPIISTRPASVVDSATSRIYEVVRDISLGNSVPAGSKMAVNTRTFKVGERLMGLDKCTGADSGVIEVQDGQTYFFPCGRNSALRAVEYENTAIDADTDGNRKIEEAEPSFLVKYKMPLIAVGVLAAIGVGYYFMKKK